MYGVLRRRDSETDQRNRRFDPSGNLVGERFRGNGKAIECRSRTESAFDSGGDDVLREWIGKIHNPKFKTTQSSHFLYKTQNNPFLKYHCLFKKPKNPQFVNPKNWKKGEKRHKSGSSNWNSSFPKVKKKKTRNQLRLCLKRKKEDSFFVC